MWRTYGAAYGAPVAVLDVAKGFGAALVASLLVDDLAGVLAGGAAMLGHWRPLFLRFAKGGKTVATAGGVLFALAPLVGLLGMATWIALFAATRYASFASIVAAIVLPAWTMLLGESWPVVAFTTGAAAAVVLLHRPNIARLRSGTESRFVFRRGAATAR